MHVYELRVGMCVCELEAPKGENPFMLDRIVIESHADIQAIQAVCDYVYIDVKFQKDHTGAIPTRSTEARKQLSFARSFEQTAVTFQRVGNLIKTVLDDIRFGNQFNTEAVKQAVAECVDQVLEHPETMLLLTQLKDQDQYTAQHCMNVCILAILLGRELKYSVEDLNKIGFCGLMHDVGKMKVPLEILNKPGKLDKFELDIMRNHTVYGRNVLMSARGAFPGAVDVAHNHHEQLNGGGYPRGLDKSALSDFTKMVAVVDTYDAMTSDRVYQHGQPHLIALGTLVKGMSQRYEAHYVTHFINCIGFYPQGNAVELSSGEIGIVVEQNKVDRLKPKILIVKDSQRSDIEPRLLDLAKPVADPQGNRYAVKQVVRAKDYRLDLNEYYRDGLFVKDYAIVGA
ncbi:HD-GYP domain-containing protein [Methylomonas sp. MED-D]|uniref:HD-GYP domain-containing protein n=1 Tax=unclassified Methylomonas TaxID=2608980 RepID=UPI0028A2E2F6|nr:HD-GYP domain-containing protein [Methylomonas sp. MV1]MDT4329954.1 HD-GYP domain-containing protein [Methylomonas sp. MV1]